MAPFPWPIRAGATVAKTLGQIARRYGETDLALAVADTLRESDALRIEAAHRQVAREAARVLVQLTVHADSADAMGDSAALGAALAEVLGRLAREARSSG